MNKFTLKDSFTTTNRTGKTKRWLGWAAFCGVLLLGQIGFAYLMPNLKEASNNELTVSTETQTEYATNNALQVVSTNASVDALAECSQISSSSSLNGGWTLGGANLQELAGDFVVVAGTTFDFETLKVSVNTASTTSFDVFIWSDNNNLPNAVLYTITGVTSTNPVLSSGAYYMHTLDISSENISFAPVTDTRYWVQVTTTGATAWERRSNTLALGVDDVYRQNSGAWNTIYTDPANNEYNLVYEVIGECTGCPTSFGLTATQASTESATINWNNFSGNLSDIQWGAAGFALGSGTIVTGLTPPYTITGLTIDTDYDVYIKCADGNDWVGPVSFTILDVLVGCDITVNVQYSSWGDYVTWQLLDGNNTAVLSGGPYGNNYNDTQTTTFLNPPYTLNIVSTLGDNGAVYSVNVGGDQDISGSSFGNFNISVPLNATSCPSCPAPTGLAVDNITFTSADLIWSDNGGDYEVEWGLSGFSLGTGTLVSPATSPVEVTGLTGQTNYQFYVREYCSVDDGYSVWAGPFTFYTDYCTASVQWTGDSIDSVETSGAITNISNTGNGTSPNGYGNFTSYVVQHFAEGEMELTVTTQWVMNVNMWIDWNNNMVFDAGELVYQSTDQQQVHTALITVPAGTPLGNYRIRVRAGYLWSTNIVPCGQSPYGEVEDYTLTVITPPTCMPPTQLGANINTFTEAELFWTSPGTLFEVQYGLQGFTLGTGTTVNNITTNSTTVSGLAENTYHHYYVRRDCGGGDLSPWAGPFKFYTNYCESITQWEWDYINSFSTTLAITNITNNNTGFSYPNGYGDYTDMVVSHFETGEVSFTLNTPSYLGVNIWVDWNNNMVFEESEKVYASGFMDNGTFTGTFTVPTGQPVGDYRMRVRGSNDNANPSPCGTINYGETEDYTFTVIPTPTCMPPTQAGAELNSLTEAVLFWTSPGTLFEIEYGLQGFTLGTGTLVDNITTTTTTLPGLTANTYYQYYIRRDCGGGDLSPWTGPYTFYTNYCEALTQWSGDYISSFAAIGIGFNIDNPTGAESNGYGNYSAMAVSHFETGEVNYTITVPYDLMAKIWVDWNNNLIFDADELIETFYPVGWNAQTYTGIITVPVGQALGDYRIRIRAGYTWDSTFGEPCGNIQYGETEDYTITVIPTPTCMPPTQLGANINSLTEAELFWTSPGTLFEVEYGLQGFTLGTGTTVDNITTNSTTLSSLTQNTYYHYYVRRDCGGGDLSPWTGPFKFYTNYCESISQNQWDYITSFVTSGGIPFDISNTNSGASPNGYGNFTSMSVHHFETGQVDFEITTTWSGMSVNMWIDWNNNMVFEEDELVASTYTGSFLIPLGTPVGDYRIRIRAGSANPCGTINYGETEDYTLTVITPPDCLPPFVPIAANISATAVSLSWQADGDVFDIEYGPTGFTPGTGTIIPGVGNPYILGPLVGGQSYDYYVRQDCNADEDGYSTWNGPVTFVPGVFEGNIPTLLNANPQVEDVACATSFAIDVPPGQFLASLTVSYTMTSSSPALDSHQRSVLYSSTLGMGEPQVATHPDPQNYPGLGFYNRNVDFANGATGTIEFELKAWRTEGGSGCGTDLVYVEDGSWVLNATFEDIPSCPNPPADLGYTNITADSVDLIWTSDEVGTFQVKWGDIGFDIETAGTTISGIDGFTHTLSGLDSSIPYEFYVRRDCSTEDEEDFGAWVGPVRFNSGHCLPYSTQGAYFTLFSTTNAVENITYSFPVGSPLGTGYVDSTDMIITAEAGETFNFTSNYVGGASALKIWVDWNNNFIFDNDEEVFFLTGPNGSKSGAIAVPDNATNGDHRMRVRVQQGATSNPNACGLIAQGEALDFILKVQGGLGISDFNSFGFKYYPNPVSDTMYLSANTSISNVTVINMLGQQVNARANSDNTQVDMSELPTGNYLIKVTIEGVSKTLKVVKK